MLSLRSSEDEKPPDRHLVVTGLAELWRVSELVRWGSMMKIRVLWVAFLITPVFPSSQAASETIERKPESLSAMSVTELAPAYRSDELSPSLRLARLEQNTSKIIPQLDAVARPSRTVFLR
jgi:hypothetical protein